jgi:uncharacterized membrane protein HdeD (DUF308 family)
MADIKQDQAAGNGTAVIALGALLFAWGGFALAVHGSAAGVLMALLGIGLIVGGIVVRLRA